jgi:hypothetical protein
VLVEIAVGLFRGATPLEPARRTVPAAFHRFAILRNMRSQSSESFQSTGSIRGAR